MVLQYFMWGSYPNSYDFLLISPQFNLRVVYQALQELREDNG